MKALYSFTLDRSNINLARPRASSSIAAHGVEETETELLLEIPKEQAVQLALNILMEYQTRREPTICLIGQLKEISVLSP